MPPPHILPGGRKVASQTSRSSDPRGRASTLLISPGFRPGPALAAGERPSTEDARRNYLTCPCARWCGRALSSSWKLPPRGARRTGRGEGCARRAGPLLPGGGLGVPALRSAEGRGARTGEGRARKPRWGLLPAPPRLQNNGFPLLPPAARRGLDGGVGGRRFRGNRARDVLELAGFRSKSTCDRFPEAGWSNLGPGSQSWPHVT